MDTKSNDLQILTSAVRDLTEAIQTHAVGSERVEAKKPCKEKVEFKAMPDPGGDSTAKVS